MSLDASGDQIQSHHDVYNFSTLSYYLSSGAFSRYRATSYCFSGNRFYLVSLECVISRHSKYIYIFTTKWPRITCCRNWSSYRGSNSEQRIESPPIYPFNLQLQNGENNGSRTRSDLIDSQTSFPEESIPIKFGTGDRGRTCLSLLRREVPHQSSHTSIFISQIKLALDGSLRYNAFCVNSALANGLGFEPRSQGFGIPHVAVTPPRHKFFTLQTNIVWHPVEDSNLSKSA